MYIYICGILAPHVKDFNPRRLPGLRFSIFPFALSKIGMRPESGAHRPFLELTTGDHCLSSATGGSKSEPISLHTRTVCQHRSVPCPFCCARTGIWRMPYRD